MNVQIIPYYSKQAVSCTYCTVFVVMPSPKTYILEQLYIIYYGCCRLYTHRTISLVFFSIFIVYGFYTPDLIFK